jgi:two-component system, NtrC family, sensor kinase
MAQASGDNNPSGGGNGHSHHDEPGRAQIRALVDHALNPVLIHDGVRIRYANQAARRLFGWPAEGEPAGRLLDHLGVYQRGGGGSEGEGEAGATAADRLIVRRADGREARFLARHVPLVDAGDWKVATFLEDLEEMHISLDRLAELDRSHTAGVLSAGLAHELASPVVPLLAALEAMAGQMDDLGQQVLGPVDPALVALADSVATAVAAGSTLASVLHDFQAFLRPGAPWRDQGLSDPVQAVERAVRMVGTRLRGVASLCLDLAPSGMIRAPAGFVTQIALNLLNNAADALAAARTPEARIKVRLRRASDGVVLEVEDDGPGLAPEVQAHLFEPHVTTKRQGASLGMGLAISRALVLRCGGDITVVSAPGQGTTFRVTFPVPVLWQDL